jgi:hypothetical protein
MKLLNWKIQLALALIGASAGLYGLNYLIFRDVSHMFRCAPFRWPQVEGGHGGPPYRLKADS